MFFLFFTVFYILGWFTSSFILGNVILIAFFSIPFTNKLYNYGVIISKKNKDIIILNNICYLTILLIIFILITIAVYLWSSNIIAYSIGSIIPIFLIFKNCKPNENNISDYFHNFGNYIDIEKVTTLFQNVN